MSYVPNSGIRKLLILWVFLFALSSYGQEQAQDTLGMIQTHHQTGLQAFSEQNYEQAIISLNTAYKLSQSKTFARQKTEILFDIVQLDYQIQNFVKAATESERLIDRLENGGSSKQLAEAYTLQGLILTELGNFEMAETALKNADFLFTRENDEASRANVLLGFGLLEKERLKFKEALNYLDAALIEFENGGRFHQEAMTQLQRAEVLYRLPDLALPNAFDQAKEALDEALTIIRLKDYKKLEIEAYRLQGLFAIRENRFEEAQEYLGIYEQKNDSLYQVYLSAISKGVEAETSVGDLTSIIDQQKSDLDKQQKSINFGKMVTGLSIALIVILSLLTLSLYKNNNLRAKANELLQDKNNELQLAKEKAEKASLAKAQFLSTITHELRTPLYAVTGLTHLLLDENPKPHQKEHLNSLKFSGEYLLSLINNILDLNKLEANKVEIERTSFNLEKRVKDVLVALRKTADDKKNNLHLEYDNNIPPKLMGDPLKLSQILINLIGNSLKFTQNGDVYVRVRQLEQDDSKVRLHFEVEDNGVGISKKKQKSIFETFSQASLQINRKFGGTGLGLSIVKNLLELMGSKIQLESTLGKGSKFWFDINFMIDEEVPADAPATVVPFEVDYDALANRNILVVEDNKINQMITKKILEKNKMHCLVADNGTDAINLVKENNFDLVLMDIHMPGISGIEATQEIRKFDRDLPIIALTAVTIDENLEEFYKAGFNEIIPKPFKTEEFFEKIYRTLENNKQPVN